MGMDDNVIPVLGIICVFGLPVLGWIASRMMRHRERMEMLRLGMMPPPDGRGWNRRNSFTGPGMPPPFPGGVGGPPGPNFGYSAYDDPNSAQCTMHRGIVTTMVGFAILIGLSFIGYRGGDGPFSPATIHPGPWLLGGLIPMFVGIAQIIIALISGAAFNFRVPPQPPPPGPPPGQRPYGSAQPGSPGPRYEELARPVPPPDRT
jgi:hypothetical protein